MGVWAVFGIFLLSTTAEATKFAPMSMEERVFQADWIGVAKIEDVQCLSPQKRPIPAGQRCGGPKSKNRMHYKVTVVETLMYRVPGYLKKSTTVPPSISFHMNITGHTTVPEDQYASARGMEMIFFLQQAKDGSFFPVHEAFFSVPLEERADVTKWIKKRQKK